MVVGLCKDELIVKRTIENSSVIAKDTGVSHSQQHQIFVENDAHPYTDKLDKKSNHPKFNNGGG